MKHDDTTWPQRSWVLSAFLAIAGFVFYLIVEEKVFGSASPQLRVAFAAFVAVGAISFAFAVERNRILWVVGFSVIWGLVLAFVAHSTLISQTGNFNLSFPFWSGLLSAGIALPLFQTIRHHGEFVLPYKDLHEHAWSDVICWCASWAFVGLSFGLAYLLASLFDLIGIELLKDLLEKEWFVWTFMGASFGAALGVFKENDRIVASLQNLVMTTLSILAPVLCISLALFLVALPFTGLQPLWDATRGTTPILLACALGAVTLTNSIIRNSLSEESGKKIMRYSAIGLSACILPLSVIALISMQQRIDQYGLTPDRIWGLVAVLVAVAYGFSYLWSVLKSRETWTENLRSNNIRMAGFLCVLTFFLALPIVNFAKISVDDQLSRIEDGRIKSEKIDYVAFAFDLGEGGRSELKKMQSSDDQAVVDRATIALAADNRWNLKEKFDEAKSSSVILSKLTVFPRTVAIPETLSKAINKQAGCLGDYCLLIWETGNDVAQLITPDCPHYNRYDNDYDAEESYQHCPPTVTHLELKNNEWVVRTRYNSVKPRATEKQRADDRKAVSNAIEQSEIEVRTVERQQVFIGGKPVGQVY